MFALAYHVAPDVDTRTSPQEGALIKSLTSTIESFSQRVATLEVCGRIVALSDMTLARIDAICQLIRSNVDLLDLVASGLIEIDMVGERAPVRLHGDRGEWIGEWHHELREAAIGYLYTWHMVGAAHG